MSQKNECTPFEAASAWLLHRDGSEEYNGLILVMDLDHAGAGLCRCQPGTPPVQLWEAPGSVNVSFFSEAARHWMSGAPEAEAAEALRAALSDPKWLRSQKAFLRGRKASDVPLPSLVLGNQVISLSCTALDSLLAQHWDEPLARMLAQAKEQLARQDGALPLRILPMGSLARLFLAEYRIREAFLEMPMLPDPLIRACGDGEDPARIADLGRELYRTMLRKPQVLPVTLRLQVQHRVGASLKPELLTLAEKDTAYDTLQNVTYVGPILIGPEDDLTIFADSQMHRISPGFLRFPDGNPFACVEVGVGMRNDTLTLFLRGSGSTRVQIPLSFI